jgi:uncharacterized protein YacL (UPF0231 family)
MDMQFLKDWSGLLAVLISIGGSLFAWLTAGSKQNSQELVEVNKSIDLVETRLTKIEAEMKHLPDEKALMALKLDITEMKGSFGRMEESISGITRTVHRVEEYLLNKGTG